MRVNDNLGNPRLLQRNYLSKCLQLRNVLADNIQFVAHHKNYIKKDNSQSFITKKFNPLFQENTPTYRGKNRKFAGEYQ